MKMPVLWLGLLVILPGALAAEITNRTLTARQRLERAQLKAVSEARRQLAQQRQELPAITAFEDFRAVIHVHAEDSNHTKGTREEVLAAAKKTGVRVVLFSDHRGPKPETWRGLRDGVLFLAGSEDGDGKLRFPDFDANRQPRTEGGMKFVCHAEERLDADTKGFDGMEIVNRHTDLVLDRSVQEYLQTAAQQPDAWRSVVEDFRAYPDEMFGAGGDHRPQIMAMWDRALRKGHLTGIGANDAHQNVIINGVTFDPYEVSFRNLCTHLLMRELTEAEVRHALRDGHCYVSHDWLCDPTGFAFGAVNNLGVFPMGDTATMQGSTRVVGLTPVPARLKLFHQGMLIAQTNGTNLTYSTKKPGAYRLEAWLAVAGEERPWIYSNPVHLKEQSLFSIPLPNGLEATNVLVKKDIVYVTDRPADEAKHKLDLYVPTDRRPAPVFLFIHGGAWRYGDRGLYPPVGQRFAKEGILTVIPSYRLAPKHPWPAQAEDTAAAFAWTMRNIVEHGGDTNRVFIGGHSAGGHLTSLLVFNERYLRPYGLGASLVRGVISLSGVYNLDVGDAQSTVFGQDREVRREASPLFFVKAPAPPFFVSYCQWDYPTLPAQAKLFHAALKRAGVLSDLFYTPKDNHIYEMISLTHDTDPTAQAVVKFIKGRD